MRGPTSNTAITCRWASGTPSRVTARVYWFSTSARPSSSWRIAMWMPSRRSSGSKPVTTIGTRYFAAIGSYSVQPMIAHTWPAARNAWTRLDGDSSSAVIAGGTSTCDTSTLKLSMPRRAASATAIALAGAVVSKPTAKNTTCRPGFAIAILSASSGE